MDTVDRKRRKAPPKPTPEEEARAAYEDIISVFAATSDTDDMKALFDDLFTESEERGLSLCKITRGSRMLKKEDGFMRRLLSSRYDEDHTHI